MNTPDLIVRSRRLVLERQVVPGAIHIRQGKICAVAPYEDILRGCPVVDVGNLAVMPGLIDLSVHLNEPSRAHWEGFEAATKAAAAGGITTLIDMPSTATPASITAEAIVEKQRVAQRRDLYVDLGFWGGLVPGNIQELKPMRHAGVLGFACSTHIEHPEDFRPAGEHTLREAYPLLARIGAPLLVRPQAAHLIQRQERIWRQLPANDYHAHLIHHPDEAEVHALELVITLSRQFKAKTLVGPISSAQSIALLKQAQASRAPISAMTAPHHLFFHSGHVKPGQTLFKCSPPIREEDDQLALWRATLDDTISLISSDHDPSPAQFKALGAGDFEAARNGIGAMQWLLPSFWTRAKLHGMTLPELAERLSARPAALLGIDHQKGKLAAGFDADLVIFNPEASFIAEGHTLKHPHPQTPYEGWILQGVVESTFLRGQCVYRRQLNNFTPAPHGRLLLWQSAPPSSKENPTR